MQITIWLAVCLAASTCALITPEYVKRPLLEITPKRAKVEPHMKCRVKCTSVGSMPLHNITWWIDNTRIDNTANSYTDVLSNKKSVSRLTFVASLENNGSDLVCRAEDPRNPGAVVEDKWNLIIEDNRPKVTISSYLQLGDIREGDDVYFSCDVSSDFYAYEFSWLKDGEILKFNRTQGIIFHSNHLVVKNVTAKSSGNYWCFASNSKGKILSDKPLSLHVRTFNDVIQQDY